MCFDWYEYTGDESFTRSGLQPKAFKKMIERATTPRELGVDITTSVRDEFQNEWFEWEMEITTTWN